MAEEVILRADRLNEDRFERSKRMTWMDIDAIQKAKVLMVGVGAIGNEVAKNLVLSGFQNITLIDMDYVVRSNLNRCLFFTDEHADNKEMKVDVVAKGMKKLNPAIKLETLTCKVEETDEDFIPSHDIVMGCLDNIGARLHLNAHAYNGKRLYVDGATLGIIGKVQVVLPPETSCLECGMNKTHMKIVEKRFSCTGENITFFEQKLAAEITTTAVVSAIMVREAIKYSSGNPDQLIRNMFYYDGMHNTSDVYEIDINPDCFHHME